VLADRASTASATSSNRDRGKKFVTPEIMLSERPAEADDRAVPGHWEGDLILGLGSSAIRTLVERTTRFTMLLHLPRLHGHGEVPSVKNGPALAGHGAEAVRDAITTLPEQLRRSLTWDQGAEMAHHTQLRLASGLAVYFCDPHSPGSAPPTSTPTGCSANTSQGHRPLETQPRRARRRRGRAEQPTTQDAPLENPSRSPRRASTLAQHGNVATTP